MAVYYSVLYKRFKPLYIYIRSTNICDPFNWAWRSILII
nr:MAG TPA: hypothetical protein [Bacteriophage sp.]DAR41932.1 MAG TPA: hypothetical protein [Bacteriophage sp.]